MQIMCSKCLGVGKHHATTQVNGTLIGIGLITCPICNGTGEVEISYTGIATNNLSLRLWSPEANKHFYEVEVVLECLKNQQLGLEDYIALGYVFEPYTGKSDLIYNKLYQGDYVNVLTFSDIQGVIVWDTSLLTWVVDCGGHRLLLSEISQENIELIGNVHTH